MNIEYQDYNKVPWYRQSHMIIACIIIPFLIPLVGYFTFFIAFYSLAIGDRDIYYKQADQNGKLKKRTG
jgi:hypothetical protein